MNNIANLFFLCGRAIHLQTQLSARVFYLLLASCLVMGCQTADPCAGVRAEIRMLESVDFSQREKATEKLLSYSPEVIRNMVVPLLISTTANNSLELTTKDSSIFHGKLKHGNATNFSVELERGETAGAVVEIETANIKSIRILK